MSSPVNIYIYIYAYIYAPDAQVVGMTPHYAALKQAYVSLKGDFLLPEHYSSSHQHDWLALDTGYCICTLCGLDHVCFQGHCPDVRMEHSERVCSISGCVILKTEMKPEWGAMERVGILGDQPQGSQKTRKGKAVSRKAPGLWYTKKVMKGNVEVHEFVDMVVREILDSPKTLRCRDEEMLRDRSRKMASLAKIFREMVTSNHDDYYQSSLPQGMKEIETMPPLFYVATHHPTTTPHLCSPRPNMLLVEAKLSWMCRKCRYHHTLNHRASTDRQMLERVMNLCVENITQLIKMHGWHRVNRQMQHASRGKEFVCSMLYLMRMGITFRNQTILQKVEILNELLPMQVFLPSVFNIRAKSITEGENLIKLDIQKSPL